MASRTFKLPGVQDLSKEQEQARALPLTGRHLIIGGPGTGKSVLTLLRARRLAAERKGYRFLVYTHLLDRSNIQLFEGRLASQTWRRWFSETFELITGHEPPRLATQDANGFREYDWNRIGEEAGSLNIATTSNRRLLVIDEGQDMPRQFYDTLWKLGFRHFFVAADQNQQITESHSSREDIEIELDIRRDEVVELRQNYRNTISIWKLADKFYTDPASPRTETPNRREGMVPGLITYAPGQFFEVARRIVLRACSRPSRLIGVIAPSNKIRQRYMRELQKAKRSIAEASDDMQLETFHGDHRPDVRFDRGGILVINVQACKGLEFDEVVCADIDGYFVNPEDHDPVKKRFYVMVARAREDLFLLKRAGGDESINRILPEDRSVLKRGPLKSEDS